MMQMRYEDILGGEFDCACGRRHEVPVRRVVYSEDALGAVDEVGQCCVMVSSPLMIMIKQLPDELEDAKEEVEIMHKWLEAGRGSRGKAAMPALYKEAYLNEIDELAVKEGLYENKD